MASLVLKMSVSLDGFVAPIDGSTDWVAAGRSDDGATWTVETLSNAGAHLMGATTYAGWAAYWPGASGPFAKPMNEIPKVVLSDSLASADWGGSPPETSPKPSRGSSRSAPTDTCSLTAGCGSPDRWSRPA
jgi:dihydrofolate reductase